MPYVYPACLPLYRRVCGLKVYKCTTDSSLSIQKEQTSGLKKDEMQDVLQNFFDNGQGLRCDVLETILVRLRGLLNALQTQRDWHFITSSLLLVYDGNTRQRGIADICMIDFAHTEPVIDSVDVEYLYGLSNLIELLTCILEKTQYEPPMTPTKHDSLPCITAAALERVFGHPCMATSPRVLSLMSQPKGALGQYTGVCGESNSGINP